MDYESEIQRLTDERKAAAERINELMQYREMRNQLIACNNEGHLWNLVGVKGDLDKVEEITLLCARCKGEASIILSEPTAVQWKDADGQALTSEEIEDIMKSIIGE